MKKWWPWEQRNTDDWCDVSGCDDRTEWQRNVRDDGVTPGPTSGSHQPTIQPQPREALAQLSVEKVCGKHKVMIEEIEAGGRVMGA